MVEKLLRYLAAVSPQRSRRDTTAYLGTAIVAILFLAFHGFLLLYFSLSGLSRMALVNVGSMLVYALSLLILRRGLVGTAGLMIVAEVSVYCIFSIYYIGWASSTQLYLPVLIYPSYMLFRNSKVFLAVNTTLLTISMFVCFYLFRTSQPYYHKADLLTISVINILVCMFSACLMMGVISLLGKFHDQQMKQQLENLSGEAYRDELTGIWNRRYMSRFLTDVFASPKSRRSYCLALLDVDQFKTINDEFGHAAGDEVLRQLAQRMVAHFRHTDICCRWGGDEFIIAIKDADEDGAYVTLEKFRRQIEGLEFQADQHKLNVTVTIGFSWCLEAEDYMECINNSDASLYYGKQHSSNQVVNYRHVMRQRESIS